MGLITCKSFLCTDCAAWVSIMTVVQSLVHVLFRMVSDRGLYSSVACTGCAAWLSIMTVVQSLVRVLFCMVSDRGLYSSVLYRLRRLAISYDGGAKLRAR